MVTTEMLCDVLITVCQPKMQEGNVSQATAPPPGDIRPGIPPATEIWWQTLVTCSNLLMSDIWWWPLKHVMVLHVGGKHPMANAFLF